jgi:NAD(P)-dependent dehydrogenase (short-subunit alcohol dehydrogenase family)
MSIPQDHLGNTSVKTQFDLTGKRVILSGGAGFLGTHFASAIAEMGGLPIILDKSEDRMQAALSALSAEGFQAEGHCLDLLSGEDVTSVIDTIMHTHDQIDVLINAAAFAMEDLKQGGQAFFAMVEDYQQDLWETGLVRNLSGAFLITQAVGRIMKEQKKGSIVNIASDVGIISPDHRIYQADKESGYEGVPFNTPASYSVAKAGILALTRYLATYWAPYGIRVNAISPAGVYREQDEGFVKQLASRIPLGRMAFPHELKGPVVFLASEASSFMTGANVVVDGGRTIW